MSMDEHNHHHSTHTESRVVNAVDYRAEYKKFFMLIAGLLVGSFGLFYLFDGQDFMNWMQLFMALFFIAFAGFKFAGYEMFVEMFPTYDLLAKRYKWYAYLYPFIEVFLGFAYLTNALGNIRDIVAVLVMGVSAYGVWKALQHRRRGGVYCACLGNVIKLPLTTISFFENATMGGMALLMLIFR